MSVLALLCCLDMLTVERLVMALGAYRLAGQVDILFCSAEAALDRLTLLCNAFLCCEVVSVNV